MSSESSNPWIPTSADGPWLGPIFASALTAVVAMWIAWFLTHMPATHAWFPPSITGPLLLSLMLVVMTMALSRVPARRGVVVGLLAGLLVGAINLLILGSKITATVEVNGQVAAAPGADGLRPDAWLIVVCFIALCAVLGVIAGLIGSRLAKGRNTVAESAGVWNARVSAIACVAVVPLLALGGMVTSTGAGLAVPDWPGTYGANMFLYPISLMAGDTRIFLEHSHRLFGAMIGVCCVLLTISTFATHRAGRTGYLRWFALVVLALVIAQGLLGAARVQQGIAHGVQAGPQTWGVAHGVLAQAFFALLVAFAALGWPRPDPLPGVASNKPLGFISKGSIALVIAIFIQLVMGALYRHLGQKHALWTHVVFSLVVVGLAVACAMWMLRRKNEARVYKTLGHGLLHSVGFQFVLGWVALLLVMTGANKPAIVMPDQLAVADAITTEVAIKALVRTIHQANGALLLALAVLAVVWPRRMAAINTMAKP
ncbi:MAG: COX15/CtaA family protein [Phycisphaerales bacterium]|nr:COX15/CtaA family protein [Phycisphaerales bacterium]